MPWLYLRKLTVFWYHLLPSPHSKISQFSPKCQFYSWYEFWVFLNIIYVYTVCYSLCASYNIPLKSEMDIIEFILQLSGPDGAAGDWWSRDLPPPPRSCTLVDWWLRFQGRSGSYQQFSEGFVWLPASSWAYHFPYTCYQKFLCKYLVIGHLVLEINWLQNQEA